MPALSMGGDMLEVIWSSRGIFMNRPALRQMAALMSGRAGRDMPKAVLDLTRIFIPQLQLGEKNQLLYVVPRCSKWFHHFWTYNLDYLVNFLKKKRTKKRTKNDRPVLQSGLVFAFGGDSHMQGLAEFVFAACLKARDPELKLQWMPSQSDRFMEGEMLLERFAFRLAAATFGWSKGDWKLSGLKRKGSRVLASKRFRQGKTKLWGSCLWKDVQQFRCSRSLLPQCLLVFHPVDSSELMRDLHYLVSRTACLAGPKLKGTGGTPLLNAGTRTPLAASASIHRGQLFTNVYTGSTHSPVVTHRVDSQASPWCKSVTKNRHLVSRLVSFSWSRPGLRLSASGDGREMIDISRLQKIE